jgi:hypothetical protein
MEVACAEELYGADFLETCLQIVRLMSEIERFLANDSKELFLNRLRISCPVIVNLERQEPVNRPQCFRVSRTDHDATTSRSLLVLIFDVGFEPLHSVYSGRNTAVRHLRSRKIALYEGLGNTLQVHPDLISAGSVVCVIGLYLDETT